MNKNKKPLSESRIKLAKSATKNSYYLWDYTGQRGGGVLGCKIYPSGKKSFYFRYAKNGKRTFIFMGNYPNIDVNEAKARKLELSSLLDSGVDPKDFIENKKQGGSPELSFIDEDGIPRQQGKFSDMVDVYVDELKRNRSGDKLVRCLARFEKNYKYYLSDFPDKAVNTITKRDIMLFLSPIAQRASVQSDKIRSILHRMFELAIDYKDDPRYVNSPISFNIDSNPIKRVKKQNSSKGRERSLSIDELALLFHPQSEQYFNPSIFRLLKLSVLMGGATTNRIGFNFIR
ncbi:Arm DNA-binding domain-containing protein [Vibrio aestuarianus]|nr:Arm DNA-binding domain-containing protein [Vibrio aestuarianus]